MKKLNYKIVEIIILYIGCFFYELSRWVASTFGKVSFNQVLFNTFAPVNGANMNFLNNFIKGCIWPSVRVLFIIEGIFFIGWYFSQRNEQLKVCTCLKKHGFPIKMPKWNSFIISLWISVVFIIISLYKIGVFEYLMLINESTLLYEEYYVDPSEQIYEFPEVKRNLIYIYLESVETTYINETEKGENLIPQLQQIAQENINFTQESGTVGGFYQVSGTGWTVAAMVGQTLGIPLSIPIGDNEYRREEFLPGAYGLGDILDNAGYNQKILLGSQAAFGGRDKLVTTHGNYEIKDHISALEEELIPKGYRVWWGYEDAKLFEFAKSEILELASLEEPFHFATLTADTHAQEGYFCSDCNEEYESQYSNVIKCSDHRVAEFIQWIQEQEFYENTTVIVVGDHLSMSSEYFLKIDPTYNRRIYHAIINSSIDVTEENKIREYSTFDVFPTTLASLGVTWGSDSLALGVNLFGEEKTLIEKMGLEALEQELGKFSQYYNYKLLYEWN